MTEKQGFMTALYERLSRDDECNNRKSDSGGGWIFLGRFGKYIFILIWAILLLSCLAFVLCCMQDHHAVPFGKGTRRLP